jgi:pimeloyl-ACP methyl ester carboxylesterase
MEFLSGLGKWISDNESLLSGAAAIIVLLGVVVSIAGILAKTLGRQRGNSNSERDVPETPESITLKELTAPADYPIRFVETEGARIAYAVMGHGEVDMMFAPGIVSHLHVVSHLPTFRNMFDALGEFTRLVTFDKRGQGLSDPSLEVPGLDQRVRDMKAVLDAAGMDRFVLLGLSEGGTMSIQFAHDYPERVRGLVLLGSTASWLQREDFPIGIEEKALDALSKLWGTGAMRDVFFPGLGREVMDDDTFRGFERLISTRAAIRQITEFMKTVDVRPLLPGIQCPTLVIHFSGDMSVPIRMGRAMAADIPNAEFMEVEGIDHGDISHSPQAMTRLREFVASLD